MENNYQKIIWGKNSEQREPGNNMLQNANLDSKFVGDTPIGAQTKYLLQ